MDTSGLPLLQPEERVLSTLEKDGRRRWIHPRLAKGPLWRARLVVGWVLIAFFTVLPWTTVAGKPTVLLDIANRRFTFFGFTFLPTDTLLLAVAVLALFLSVFFITAVFGRLWCGWACPQTVYLEFVFRPIQRFFMGRAGVGGAPGKPVAGWRYAAMYAAYLVISIHLANTFLAYFVGVENLNRWIWAGTPWRHPGAFALVVIVTAWMMFDLAYWREQMCIIGCPYGRFQSVMLDRQSLIVSYDPRRGEPRGSVRKGDADGPDTRGDCVDCTLCVQVCPTGIDIRQGLQLECINCAQCIDACNAVMTKLGRDTGLIRYSSQAAIEGKMTGILRPRVVIYCVLVAALGALFISLLVTKPSADVTVLRNVGRPFAFDAAGDVENWLLLKIANRTDSAKTYRIGIGELEGVRIMADDLPVVAGGVATQTVRVVAPASLFHGRGSVEATLRVTDGEGLEFSRSCRLLGPASSLRRNEGREDAHE